MAPVEESAKKSCDQGTDVLLMGPFTIVLFVFLWFLATQVER